MSAFNGLTINNPAFAGQGRVKQAIASASARTGVDFSYLMGQAQIESAMNPSAASRNSSAKGLYQFLDQSWLAVVNNHGADHGMDWAANAIQKTSGGRYYVSDPQVRQQILDLRNHPETASVMAAELASDNRDFLEKRTGKAAEPVDLYLAHFLGAGGAAKFLSAMDSAPGMSGANLFPAAARSNASVFYDRQGNPRSLAEIRGTLAQRLDSGTSSSLQTGTAQSMDNYSLPPGANMVAPADYMRIAQQRFGVSAALADPNANPNSTDVQDPDLMDGTGDSMSLNDVQALTLNRAFAPATTNTETARLAYLMLATLGR